MHAVRQCDLALASEAGASPRPASRGVSLSTPGRRGRPQCSRQAGNGDAPHGEQIDAKTAWNGASSIAWSHRPSSPRRPTSSPASSPTSRRELAPAARLLPADGPRCAKAYELASGAISASFAHEEGARASTPSSTKKTGRVTDGGRDDSGDEGSRRSLKASSPVKGCLAQSAAWQHPRAHRGERRRQDDCFNLSRISYADGGQIFL